jgi:acetyl esterase
VPLDPPLAAFLDNLAAAGAKPLQELSVEEARRVVEESAAGMFGPVDAVGLVAERAIPGPNGPIRLRVYEPEGDRPFPVLVYFHGGGWVVGSLDTHDGVCRALARLTPCVVVSVDYRLAPGHRFPEPFEDAWAATAWTAEHAASIGGDPGRIAVGGDSAGGNLAAAVALRARDRGLPLAFQLLVYPVCDYDLDTGSYLEHATGYWLTRDAMRWYWEHYLGPDGDGADPCASPLRAGELAGVAPALVITAEFDPLLDEGEAYARRLEQAGIEVTLSRYAGMIHGFFRMRAVTDRTQDALEEAAAALGAAFSRGARTPGSSGSR